MRLSEDDEPGTSSEISGPVKGSAVRFRPPPAFLEIARALESRGYEAWAVGGAVRDSVGGEIAEESRSDWDLATDAHPSDVRRLFRRTVPIGIEHGTVGVLGTDGTLYDVTTFRRDVETDGRHAVVEFAERIEDDLARRDFTINAIAWRPATDEIRDPFHGGEDLEARVLRAVGVPADRFSEDYLRVLRGLRFAGRFGLRMEEQTDRALREASGGLDRLSAERVREELLKVLTDPRPSDALRLYQEVNALEVWYPELLEAVEDPNWEPNLAAVDAIGRRRPLLRLARWLMPLAGDGKRRADLVGPLLERLRFSHTAARRVTHLARHSPPMVSSTDSAARIRNWLAEVGSDSVRDLFRLQLAGARAATATEPGSRWVGTWHRVHDVLLGGPPLRIGDLKIDGGDLLALGVAQGPVIGRLLQELHAEALEDPDMNERVALLARARELIELTGPQEPSDG